MGRGTGSGWGLGTGSGWGLGTGSGSGSPICCGKAFLVIINIIFILLGFTMLGGGLFLKFGQSVVSGLIMPAFQSASSIASAAGAGSATGGVTINPSDITSLMDVAAYVLIGMGAFMFVISICGCAGACCSVKCMLGIYAAGIGLVFIGKIVILALWLTKAVDPEMFSAMQNDIYTKYAGPTSFNTESLLLNAIMVELKCCGIENYTEFWSAQAWNRTISQSGYTVEQSIPITCCIVTGVFPEITPNDNMCTINTTSINANIDTNCHTAVQTELDQNMAYVIGIYTGVLAFEAICMAVAICILVKIQKKADKKNRVHPSQPSELKSRPPPMMTVNFSMHSGAVHPAA